MVRSLNFFKQFSTHPSIHVSRYSRFWALVPLQFLFPDGFLQPRIPRFCNVIFCVWVPSQTSLRVSRRKLFAGWSRSPAQPLTWRTGVFLLFWVISFDLSSMVDPANIYATVGIALRIFWPRKPHHYCKVGILSRRRRGGGSFSV
jgi:hypothetical protein